jgi:hypothetical protein
VLGVQHGGSSAAVALLQTITRSPATNQDVNWAFQRPLGVGGLELPNRTRRISSRNFNVRSRLSAICSFELPFDDGTNEPIQRSPGHRIGVADTEAGVVEDLVRAVVDLFEILRQRAKRTVSLKKCE